MPGDADNQNVAPDTLELSDGGDDGEEWSLFAAGDCALAEGARDPADSIVSDALRRRVSAAEIAVANLEAPVRTDTAEPIPKSGPRLENPESAPDIVQRAGFDTVTLANNHVMDYGVGGLRATLDACADAGLRTVGAGDDRLSALEPATVTVETCDVALVNVCEREFGVAGTDTPGTAWSGHSSAIETVRQAARRSDVVVLFAHGGVEYVPFPPPARRERLRRFVDEGADLVVAHHPHVPQGWERYGDGFIVHSLGNFLFDSQSDADATSWGLGLEVHFEGRTPVEVELVPVAVVDGQVDEMSDSRSRSRADHLGYLHRLSEIIEEDLEPYWQELALRTFYRTYSTWLHEGIGDDVARASANPFDAAAHRPLWDPDRRHSELLTLLNVVRNESHRAVVTTALETLTGVREDRRTSAVSDEVDDLLAWTRP